MTTRPVTINLPDELYDRLRERAARTRRSVEEEMIMALTHAIPDSERLPSELENALTEMTNLSNADLWQAARKVMPARDVRRLESLHHKRSAEDLTEAESLLEVRLIEQYERAMLLRAHAMALLKERGHDISVLLGRQ